MVLGAAPPSPRHTLYRPQLQGNTGQQGIRIGDYLGTDGAALGGVVVQNSCPI